MAQLFKFTVLYRKVDDENALDEFFMHTHLRLTEQLPNLRKTEVIRVTGKPGGQSRFVLSYSAYFSNYATFIRSFLSEPGLELMAALKQWEEARIISMFFGEVFEEDTAERLAREAEEETAASATDTTLTDPD